MLTTMDRSLSMNFNSFLLSFLLLLPLPFPLLPGMFFSSLHFLRLKSSSSPSSPCFPFVSHHRPTSSVAPPVNPYALFVFNYWKKAALVDIGENLSVPINTSKGQWWHYILAGGVAGGVSRTATAPLDRIKTVLQLQVKVGFSSPSYLLLLCVLLGFVAHNVSSKLKDQEE
jgi:hypothetical protein